MADKTYVDEWGEVRTDVEPHPWADFDPWRYWSDEFDWQNCQDDLREQDIIVWRDDVIHRRKKKTTFINAARLVIGRICAFKANKAYLMVIFSSGLEPLEKDSKIKRSLHVMTKYGVYRLIRQPEDIREAKPEPDSPKQIKSEQMGAGQTEADHPKLKAFFQCASDITVNSLKGNKTKPRNGNGPKKGK